MSGIVDDIKLLVPNSSYSDEEIAKIVDIVFDEVQSEVKPFKSFFKITLYKDIEEYDLVGIVNSQIGTMLPSAHLMEITHMKNPLNLEAELINNVVLKVKNHKDDDYVFIAANMWFDSFENIPEYDKIKFKHAIIYGTTGKIVEALGQQDQEQYANYLFQRFYQSKKQLKMNEPEYLDFEIQRESFDFENAIVIDTKYLLEGLY